MTFVKNSAEPLNRAIAPPTTLPDSVALPHVEQYKLLNGNVLQVVRIDTDDVVKVDVIVEAGTRYQDRLLTAHATGALLSEGTTTKSASQIAECLDFMGSHINVSISHDYSTITLLSSTRQFNKSLQILADMLFHPVFADNELEIYRKESRQAFVVAEGRVVTLARRNLFSNVFKNGHPYGAFAQLPDFDLFTRNDLLQFYEKNYRNKRLFIVLVGKVTSADIDLVAKQFDNYSLNLSMEVPHLPPITIDKLRKIFTPKADAVQNAIYVGKATIGRTHPDFPALSVLITVLGGYFGSRLMSNIREDKGYTYGINSMILPFCQAGLFTIATEVGSDYSEKTITEIFNEMARLRNDEIPQSELDLVKNFLMGELLRTFDGPFAISDSLTSLYQYNNFDFSYLNRIIDTIKNVTSTELLQIANKYLTPDGLVVSVAGK